MANTLKQGGWALFRTANNLHYKKRRLVLLPTCGHFEQVLAELAPMLARNVPVGVEGTYCDYEAGLRGPSA